MPTEIARGLFARTVDDILADGDARDPSRVDPPQLGDSLPPVSELGNERAVIGGNNPPPDEVDAAPTPYEITKKEIDDLYEEVKNWADGEPITNRAQADDVAALRDKLRGAAKAGEERRKTEVKPLDDAKKVIQDRYNPLIKDGVGLASKAISVLNDLMKPYLKKIDDDQRAEAARLRKLADDAAAEALGKAKAAAQTTNLDQRESAEDALAAAKDILRTANVMEKAKPQLGGLDGARKVGMKSVWSPVLIDPSAALTHYRKAQPGKLKEWLIEQARADVRAGVRDSDSGPGIAGFRIDEDRVPS